MASRRFSNFTSFLSIEAFPLLIVPYMGKSGVEFCEEHKLHWIDLSGNAHIKTPGLLVHVEGRPNQNKKAGRPVNIFAPKSARIVRQLLVEPENNYNQRKISQIVNLDEGFTSRIVRKLENLDLIVRDKKGALKASNPRQLLETWAEAYDFKKHQIIKGHVAARSGVEIVEKISQVLNEEKMDYALTGLAAAWQFNHFAKFRLATLYLADLPRKNLLELLGFREDDRGANTWLVVPNDSGVFQGSLTIGGIVCVHPVQVYIDLKEHPERAKEASSMLLQESLKWGQSG
jgi:predicted transcriptional regulator